MDELAIRELAPGDVEAVVEVALAAWRPIYAGYRQALGDEIYAAAYVDPLREKERQIRVACEPASATRVLVAALAGQVVGFLTYQVPAEGAVGVIGNNAVAPGCRGRGIAPALYERAFEEMRARGLRVVRVGTGLDPAHAAARRAYEKVGFTVGLPSIQYYRKL